MPPGPAEAPNLALAAGMRTLAATLEPHGFVATRPAIGRGSGGSFATSSFVNSERILHLSVRGTSLVARYDLDGNELDHNAYMHALLGPAGDNAFPAFADDLERAFAALNNDLQTFATDFVSGPGHEYRRCWTAANAAQNRGGFKRIGDAARQLGGS